MSYRRKDVAWEAMHTVVPGVPLPGLESVRTRRGLTRPALAELAGCSVGTVNAAEGRRGNRSVCLHTAQRIADALGVTVETLTGTSMTEGFARSRAETARFLLEYRAVPYVGKRGKAKAERQRREVDS